nr:MAG TPA: hypothetical protein [Caudoviricetes sp.]
MQFLGAAPQAADRSRIGLVGLDENLLGAQSLAAFANRHVTSVERILFKHGKEIRRIGNEAHRAGIDARHGGISRGKRQSGVLDVPVGEDLLRGHLDLRMIAVKRLSREVHRFEPHIHERFGGGRPHLHAVVQRVHQHRHAIIGHIREADFHAVEQYNHLSRLLRGGGIGGIGRHGIRPILARHVGRLILHALHRLVNRRQSLIRMGFHHGLGLADAIGDRLHRGGVGRHLSRLLRHRLHGIRSLHARRLRTGSRSLRRISRLSSRSRLRLHHGTSTGQILQNLRSDSLSLTLRIKHHLTNMIRRHGLRLLQAGRQQVGQSRTSVKRRSQSTRIHIDQIRELHGRVRIRHLHASDETPSVRRFAHRHLVGERVVGRRNGDGGSAVFRQSHVERVAHDGTLADLEPFGRHHMHQFASQDRDAIGAWMSEIEIDLSQNILLKNRDMEQ